MSVADQLLSDVKFDMHALLSPLHTHVREAVEHPHANYVLQKVVELMPADEVGFVCEELAGRGFWAATHRYGCRVILRIARHLAGSHARGGVSRPAFDLVDEVLERADELCCSSYGPFVAREVLETGLPQHQHRVAQARSARPVQMASRPKRGAARKTRMQPHGCSTASNTWQQ